MSIWNCRHIAVVVALFASLLATPFDARAEHVKVVSGLMGAQDSKSKELSALSPDAANQAATQDLLSVLKPTGRFDLDNSHNVESMTFVTHPYQTDYRYVCREDRVTLQYANEGRYDAAGNWLENSRQPVGVEAQQLYHIDQLPVPGFTPGVSYSQTICDERHPAANSAWFTAPSALDAVRAINIFQMAEDEIRAGRLKPRLCDKHGSDTCSQWILSLSDPSKIHSVEHCTEENGGACYVISFGDADITVSGTIPRSEPIPVTPTAITSVRADTVTTISE